MLTTETQAVVKERKGIGTVIAILLLGVIVSGFVMTNWFIDEKVEANAQTLALIQTQNSKLVDRLTDLDKAVAEVKAQMAQPPAAAAGAAIAAAPTAPAAAK